MSMLKRIIVLMALLCALAVPGSAAAQGEEPLRVLANQHVHGTIATVTQDIVVDGEIDGDVTSWGGSIVVNGHVAGDVVSYAGRVTIAPSARIDGNVLAASGDIDGVAARVSGQTVGESRNGRALASVVALFVPGQQESPTGPFDNIVFGVLALVFLAAFSLLWAALWPRRTSAAAYTLHMLPGRSIVLGLTSTVLLATAILPLAALLAATVIGLPVLVVVLLALQLPFVYGITTLVQTLGTPPVGTVDGRTMLVAVVCAAIVGGAVVFSPLAGGVVFYLLASPGLGAVVLSRGGIMVPRLAQTRF